MKARKLYSYIFVFFGLLLGFILFMFDRWLDVRKYSFRIPWSLVILAYMIVGGVIGNLLRHIFNDQLQKEEAIKEDHRRLHDLLNSLPGIVIVLGENFRVHYANRNYIMEFGEREGKFCYNMVGQKNPCENCEIEEVLRNGLPLKSEEVFLNSKIYEVILQPFRDVDGSKLVIKTLYDITERKKAEQELLRMQAEMAHLERLNLVGQMAAGIAHEIRNPMTTVRGYLQLLGAKPEFQSHGSTFELLISELDRANSIISEFLSIAKDRERDIYCQNINSVLQHLYPLLETDTYIQNKKIVLETEETPDILFDAKEISQLVLNLCRNGLEAMQVGGTLTIRTYIEDDHVVLSVEDEGGGIQSEYLDKLGIPFFTTKENGTGLGLSTCFSIADRHNATIDLKSSCDGTAFFVRFPSLIVNQ
ncbi:Signal transduction histidine kinase, nitrogen specific [Candidatus Desulfosporosinus infrequens]|uniref:histidine kinase n=1 Tax=Candidatus Desulfosporosinus infrequens TaxID=2043169 RepID=A0A2U3LM94_9FIRM|nr:Signal transduction histidine kinase, nitrogen specific [Candidatus Desulfosporosinus infrequens]